MDTDSDSNSSSDSNSTAVSHQPAAGGSGHLPVLAAIALGLAVPLCVLFALVCALVPGLPWWLGVLVGLIAAGLLVFLRVRNAASSLLGSFDAVPADPGKYARLHNLVEGLSLAGGVPEPDLHVIADNARNAAVIAQGESASLVVTTGLLDSLDRVALEGVIAEALVRIRSGDAEAATLGASLFGGLAAGPLGAALKPAMAIGLQKLLNEDRDLSADRAAVALTRYPPGLFSALSKMRAGSVRPAAAGPANDHVWLVPPSSVEQSDTVVVASAPLDLRIDVLGEL